MSVAEAVGIRFEACGKVYSFSAEGMELKRGEYVVVESDMGVSIGRVVLENVEMQDEGREIKPVLRRVTDEDRDKECQNEELGREAFAFCDERIMARGLEMKLLDTSVTLDRRRIVFYFAAETRIDFRELVKDLAAQFRTRIELRQVGVRDAARITGGMGICGRELCCRTFLTRFEPISIKMAKQQELALNTGKLSGLCGRLLCCLGYEYEDKPGKKRAKDKERPKKEPAEAHQEDRAEDKAEPQIQAEAEQEPGAEPVAEAKVDKRAKAEQRAETGAEAKAPAKEDAGPPRKGPRKEQVKKPGKELEKETEKDKAAPEEKPQEQKATSEGDKPASKPFKKRRRRRFRGKKKKE